MTHFLNFLSNLIMEEKPTLSAYSFYFHYDYHLHSDPELKHLRLMQIQKEIYYLILFYIVDIFN